MDRHTITDEIGPHVKADDAALAPIMARNALRQFDAGMRVVEAAIRSKKFVLDVPLVCELHRIAVEGTCDLPGQMRKNAIGITNSDHRPPNVPPDQLQAMLQELCDYVNAGWERATAIHLASYVMWRLNWIHPFADGNGRTSRMLSYMVLAIKLGFILPGTPTIPEQIVAGKQPYYEALARADEHHKKGKLNMIEMEELLEEMLATQLRSVVKTATGN